MQTISRSVDRVFQILTLFASHRRPLSATEIRQELNMPHSSAVSVLTRLVALGYLDQNAETKRFFPTLQLTYLCESVPDGIALGSLPARLVDAVHAKVGETTSVSRLCDLFTMPVYVRTAAYKGAHQVIPGCTGGLATQSVVGQTLLSLKSNEGLEYFIQRSEYWARRTRVAIAADSAHVMRSISSVRANGYLCAFDQLLPGVGVVSRAFQPPATGEPMAITVAGPTERIRRNAGEIIAVLIKEVGSQGEGKTIATSTPEARQNRAPA